MNKKEKKTIVPRLRFPEFNCADEWNVKTLGDVTYAVSQKNSEAKQYPIYSINNKEGFLPQSEQFEGVDGHSRGYDISLYKIVGKNTFAYNPARINVGSIGYSGDLFNIIISSLYICFKTSDEVEDTFLQCFLETSSFNKQVINNSEGGIRNYLFYENFSKIIFPFPQIEEQKKIADCLSTLDDLIRAENEKLLSLREHKKGLIQKLFPAEGKTLPEWRFPEYRNQNPWTNKTIGQISKNIIAGGTPSTLKPEYWNGSIKWMNSGELNLKRVYDVSGRITELGLKKSSAKLIPEQCVLIGLAGQGKTRGTVAMNMVEVCVNQSIAAIFPNTKVFDSNFLYHNLDGRYNELRQISKGDGGRGGLNLQIIKSLIIALPSIEEQQKIAYCLSNVDELVTAQIENVEALKQHKKALIQNLFPSEQGLVV